MKVTFVEMLFAFVGFASNAFAQNVPDEARRHYYHGVAAFAMAKSPTDDELAIREFEWAARLAPDWPDARYNRGMVREKVEQGPTPEDYAAVFSS